MSKHFSCILVLSILLNTFGALAQEYIPYRKGKLWGYSNRKKKILIDCQYEETRFFIYDLAKVKKFGKWGLIDKEGLTFLPLQYDIIYAAAKEGRVVVCMGGDRSGHGGKWGIVPVYKGEEIPLEYDLIRESGSIDLLGLSINQKWGGMNDQGRIVIPIQYSIQHTQDHRFAETDYAGLIPENIQEPSANPNRAYLKLVFQKGLARVSLDQKWGYINEYGNEIIPIQYDFVGNFSEGLLCVIRSIDGIRKIGFVNREHQLVIPLEYDFVPDVYRNLKMQEGLIPLRKNAQWGYLNNKNQVEIPFTFTLAKGFREGLAAVSTDNGNLQNQWQFINPKGELIFKVNPSYQLIDFQFREGFIQVRHQGKEGFLNREGELLQGFRYDKVRPFKDGLAQVFLGGKMGFINTRGEEVIPLEYDPINEIPKWVGEKTRVRKNGKWGIIDTKNRIIVPFKYESIRFPFTFVFPFLFVSGPLPAQRAGKWGFVNAKGKEVIPCQYEDAYPFQKGFAKVKSNGYWGFINDRGVEYFED